MASQAFCGFLWLAKYIGPIQSGGKEMQLAMNRLASPEEFQKEFEGVTLEIANRRRERSETLTLYYAGALQKLSEMSHHGYRSADIDPVYQANFRRYIGPVSYKKLERAVARCERNKQSLLENHRYGPTGFRIFLEAGQQGDQLIDTEIKEVLNSLKKGRVQ